MFCTDFVDLDLKEIEEMQDLIDNNKLLPTTTAKSPNGYTIFSNVCEVIPPNGKLLIRTNVPVKIPRGHFGKVTPMRPLMALLYGTSIEDSALDLVLVNCFNTEIAIHFMDIVADIKYVKLAYIHDIK